MPRRMMECTLIRGLRCFDHCQYLIDIISLIILTSSGVRSRVGSVSKARSSSRSWSKFSLADRALESGASLCKGSGRPCSNEGCGTPRRVSSSDKMFTFSEISAARCFKLGKGIDAGYRVQRVLRRDGALQGLTGLREVCRQRVY